MFAQKEAKHEHEEKEDKRERDHFPAHTLLLSPCSRVWPMISISFTASSPPVLLLVLLLDCVSRAGFSQSLCRPWHHEECNTNAHTFASVIVCTFSTQSSLRDSPSSSSLHPQNSAQVCMSPLCVCTHTQTSKRCERPVISGEFVLLNDSEKRFLVSCLQEKAIPSPPPLRHPPSTCILSRTASAHKH